MTPREYRPTGGHAGFRTRCGFGCGAVLVPAPATAATPPGPARPADYAVAKELRLQERLGEYVSAALRAGDPLADITVAADPDNVTAVVRDGAVHEETRA